ncbi:MAG TPA: 5'-3' exonuclease H3TH domain-containing protein [Candidatus Limnocylindrales bacterium]|nr:5'-3' exonuclease H3TH domain-containing protein [Candidatus Limnocylindrales bacterium]
MRCLLVVDFANLAHRAYFAGRGNPTFAPDGRPVFLVATFLRMVLARIREERATHVALAFESTTGSRRRELHPDYKPRKAGEPDDLVPQLRDANIAAGRLNWARYRAEGWEADDAMAGIAEHAVTAGFDQVLLLTGDHDLLGVVGERVAVLMPRAGGVFERYGPAEVETRSPYRVPPAQVADVKALIGDSTDGYGGVRGIGPTAGPELVRRFGSIAALYERIDEVEAAGVRSRLLAGRADAFRCLDLATLRRDAPLSPAFDPDAGLVGSHDPERAATWLRAMGLPDLVRALPAPAAGRTAVG